MISVYSQTWEQAIHSDKTKPGSKILIELNNLNKTVQFC